MAFNKERGSIIARARTSILLTDDVEITKFEVNKMIERGLLTSDEAKISEIFEKIDVMNTGKIRRSELLDYVTNHKDLSRTSIKDNIKIHFQSESEKIFLKLKKLKDLCMKLKQHEAVKDIEWIIESLMNADINEPILNDINSEEMEVLKHYSKVEQMVQRNNDLSKVGLGKATSSKNTTGFKHNGEMNATNRQSDGKKIKR